ncbi:RNA polymerase factor sigma-54 [Phreatobacter sp. AB_2022a]|uniref:RNA polymerase factor sigma-54 n=1 Tax=Phreatobacter sp. AB_2022a TaxID=3003134 RepID=UPI0022872AF7|nr:RNA polymerase factor sigma-54 [Phreatobacter sp. AB_2022a]MCZ0736120.1 RNA polymerase factor sigma-54 [Phreatobacter sp. AB_2022a]
MALSARLELRVGQSLVMTPQLMQAIKLLQLSNLDLVAYVEAELEKNPLLERAEPAPEPAVDGEAPVAAPAAERDAEAGDWLGDELDSSRTAIEERLGTEMENVFPDDKGPEVRHADAASDPMTSSWSNVGSGGRDEDDYNLEAFVSADLSLADHLSNQLALAVETPQQRLIGQMLIDAVDEAGYLTVTTADVADRLGADPAEVERILGLIQAFEPSGVAARNLAECLAIQLRDQNRFDPAMQALVGHLDLLARRDFQALKRICGVDDEDLADMVAEIRRLNPKPGLAYGFAPVQALVPDVMVRAGPDGGWLVELNTETLPKVLVNQSYYARVSKTAKTETDKTFLADAMQTATWLTRALDQRARTILKVATEIVRQQDAFFALGVQYLRPLNLKTIADAISMHESTVSRVTSNKSMATSRGIFEMKYFFTSAIASSEGGESHSAEAVRFRIKQMIDQEDAADILSDDAIMDKLRESGIDIARRTVAKYREALRIPSSVQRRREKQAMAAS